MFAMEDIQLEFDPFAVDAIVEKAIERKTGARALRSIVEEFMVDIMFDLPERREIGQCIITRDVVNGVGEPIYLEREKKSA